MAQQPAGNTKVGGPGLSWMQEEEMRLKFQYAKKMPLRGRRNGRGNSQGERIQALPCVLHCHLRKKQVNLFWTLGG